MVRGRWACGAGWPAGGLCRQAGMWTHRVTTPGGGQGGRLLVHRHSHPGGWLLGQEPAFVRAWGFFHLLLNAADVLTTPTPPGWSNPSRPRRPAPHAGGSPGRRPGAPAAGGQGAGQGEGDWHAHEQGKTACEGPAGRAAAACLPACSSACPASTAAHYLAPFHSLCSKRRARSSARAR